MTDIARDLTHMLQQGTSAALKTLHPPVAHQVPARPEPPAATFHRASAHPHGQEHAQARNLAQVAARGGFRNTSPNLKFSGPVASPQAQASAQAAQLGDKLHARPGSVSTKVTKEGLTTTRMQLPGRGGNPTQVTILSFDAQKLQLQPWSAGRGSRQSAPQLGQNQNALAAVNGTFSGPQDAYPVGDVISGQTRSDAAAVPRAHSYIRQDPRTGAWTHQMAQRTVDPHTGQSGYDVPAEVRRSSQRLIAGGAPLLLNGTDRSQRLDRDADKHARYPEGFNDDVADARHHTVVGFAPAANGSQRAFLVNTEPGLTLQQVGTVLKEAGATDAMALDGGHAAQMWTRDDGKISSQWDGPLPSGMLVTTRK